MLAAAARLMMCQGCSSSSSRRLVVGVVRFSTQLPPRIDAPKQQQQRSPFERRKANILHYFKVAVGMSTYGGFDSDEVVRRYEYDPVSREEWCLVYNDRISSFVQRCGAIGLPAVIFFVSTLALDYYHTDAQFHFDAYRRLYGDAMDMGYFAFVPAAMAVVSFSVLLRVQSLYLLRVYQSRAHPNTFKAQLSKGPFFRQWITLDRSELECLTGFHEPNSYKMILLGSVRLKKKWRLRLNDSAFRLNNFRSYLLSETDVVPKKLSTLDIA